MSPGWAAERKREREGLALEMSHHSTTAFFNLSARSFSFSNVLRVRSNAYLPFNPPNLVISSVNRSLIEMFLDRMDFNYGEYEYEYVGLHKRK